MIFRRKEIKMEQTEEFKRFKKLNEGLVKIREAERREASILKLELDQLRLKLNIKR
jgi:hypothetical protein